MNIKCLEKSSWHLIRTQSLVNVIIEHLVHFQSHRESYLVESSRLVGMDKTQKL
jgi:hypothetical protein